MESKIRTWLSNIKLAIQEIKLLLPDKRDFFEFRNDLKTRRAIDRNLNNRWGGKQNPEGGSWNPDKKLQENHWHEEQDYPWVRPCSRRIIWSIVVRDLPKLESEALAIPSPGIQRAVLCNYKNKYLYEVTCSLKNPLRMPPSPCWIQLGGS